MALRILEEEETVLALQELAGDFVSSFVQPYYHTGVFFIGYCPPHTDEYISDEKLPKKITIRPLAIDENYVFFVVDNGVPLVYQLTEAQDITFDKTQKHGCIPADKLDILSDPVKEQEYYDAVNAQWSPPRLIWRYKCKVSL